MTFGLKAVLFRKCKHKKEGKIDKKLVVPFGQTDKFLLLQP